MLTGRGADLIVIDDPLKPEEALSQTQRQAANDWFDHTLYSRLNDKLAGAIVLIMHRLYEDDLVGHALAQEAWEVVRFPAIAQADEALLLDTALGPRHFACRRGEALRPEREPLAVLAHIRRTIGEYNFAGQYQQAPAPLGGGLVKAAWFRRYAPDEAPPRFERIVQSWDTANKATELRDISVCTSWGVAGKNLYLIDVLRRRMEYPRIEARGARAIRAVRPLGRADRGQGLGHAIDPRIDRRRPPAPSPGTARNRKVMRLHAQTATIENGLAHLPQEAPSLAPYLAELTSFPRGKHDDQVDSTAQMLDWFKAAGPGPGGFNGYYRMLAQALPDPQAPKPALLSATGFRRC